MSSIINQSVQVDVPVGGFVDRKDELDSVNDSLEKIQQGIYFSNWIIKIYGIHDSPEKRRDFTHTCECGIIRLSHRPR